MNKTAAKINFPLIKKKKNSALKFFALGGGFPFSVPSLFPRTGT
jgi:hypothetical protein